jgi:hypothetical protein
LNLNKKKGKIAKSKKVEDAVEEISPPTTKQGPAGKKNSMYTAGKD